MRSRAAASWSMLRVRRTRVAYSTRSPATAGNVPAASVAIGNVNWKTAPRGSLAVPHSRPPCASTIERLIARPMPMPCGLVVWNARNSWSRCVAPSPGPRIGHADQHGTRFGRHGGDRQLARRLAVAAHRLDGVHHEIEEHLLQLDPVPEYRRQVVAQPG